MIAITGIGAIMPNGTGRAAFLASLGSAGGWISGGEDFGGSLPEPRSLGRVRNFQPKDYIPAMKARRMSRFSQLALCSAIEAVQDAGLRIADENRLRCGVAVGTGIASTSSTDSFYEGLLREGPEGTNPMVFPETVQNIAAAHIGMHFTITGPNITFSQTDISSELALSYACGLLAAGAYDCFIVTGADELSPSLVIGYDALGLLADRMLPYGSDRAGFVPAEGAATLVLERTEDARRRGAKVYAEVAGVCFSSSPVQGIGYDESGRSMAGALRSAAAALGGALPGFIVACANSSRALDRLECGALREVFGPDCRVPVRPLRGLYGYFPSDGMARIAAAALCIAEGIVPAGLEPGGPVSGGGCLPLPSGGTASSPETAIVNSFSAGGSAAATVLRRPA
ncbi:MAG: beta-ketoacyl-ACP synthase II [Thermodesulfovibrionales bacterium]